MGVFAITPQRKAKSNMVLVRLDDDELAALDALAKRLDLPSRADAIRYGLGLVEAEAGKKNPKKSQKSTRSGYRPAP